MSTTITVIGHRAARLGGLKDNNPHRAWLRAKLAAAFAELLRGPGLADQRTVEERKANCEVHCNLENGVGQWAAEAALDAGIPFVAHLTADQEERAGSAPQRARLAELVKKAARVVDHSPGKGPAGAEARDDSLVAKTRDAGGVLVCVRIPGEVVGYTYEAERSAESLGIKLVKIDPSTPPPQYRAAAVMQDLRARLAPSSPPSVLDSVKEAIVRLQEIAKDVPAEPSTPVKERIKARLLQLYSLEELLRAVAS